MSWQTLAHRSASPVLTLCSSSAHSLDTGVGAASGPAVGTANVSSETWTHCSVSAASTVSIGSTGVSLTWVKSREIQWELMQRPLIHLTCSSHMGLRCVEEDTCTLQLDHCSHRKLPGHTGCWSRGQSYSWCRGLQCSLVDTCTQHCFRRRCSQHWHHRGWWSKAPDDRRRMDLQHSLVDTCTQLSDHCWCSQHWLHMDSGDTGSGCTGQKDLEQSC